jgi:hypothetical protein
MDAVRGQPHIVHAAVARRNEDQNECVQQFVFKRFALERIPLEHAEQHVAPAFTEPDPRRLAALLAGLASEQWFFLWPLLVHL